MINLLTNAIKFTPAGGKVVVSAARNASGGMVVSVKDNGPGIPAHEIQSVLDVIFARSLPPRMPLMARALAFPL